MAFQERRWIRKQPTSRQEVPDFYGAIVEEETIYVTEGDEVEVETTEFVRGQVEIVSHPDFLTVDGTALKGTVPLIAEDEDEEDTYEIELEAHED